MKQLLVAGLLLVLGGIALREEVPVAGQTSKAPIQFTTSVVQEKSCSPTSFSLELRFTFKNIGRQPVIIDKQSFVTRTLVSESLKAAAAKKYEDQSRADVFADIFPLNPKDISDFVVIGPGETYDLHTEQTRISLLVSDGTPDSKEYLRPGSYFLQVEIATWTYLTDARQFRQRWKSTGVLWSKGLMSQPMPFVIEPDRVVSKCS